MLYEVITDAEGQFHADVLPLSEQIRAVTADAAAGVAASSWVRNNFV